MYNVSWHTASSKPPVELCNKDNIKTVPSVKDFYTTEYTEVYKWTSPKWWHDSSWGGHLMSWRALMRASSGNKGVACKLFATTSREEVRRRSSILWGGLSFVGHGWIAEWKAYILLVTGGRMEVQRKQQLMQRRHSSGETIEADWLEAHLYSGGLPLEAHWRPTRSLLVWMFVGILQPLYRIDMGSRAKYVWQTSLCHARGPDEPIQDNALKLVHSCEFLTARDALFFSYHTVNCPFLRGSCRQQSRRRASYRASNINVG